MMTEGKTTHSISASDVRRSVSRWAALFINPRIRSVTGLPRYWRNWFRFQRMAGRKLSLTDAYPCLGDNTSATFFDAHYFHQAAWLARELAKTRPSEHVDISSETTMVGILSAFVPTTFYDYRPLQVTLEGLSSKQGDILALPPEDRSVHSLSCLHVIEHIGLGRYGDPIAPDGPVQAARELARILAPGGRLYVSTPVGRARVCFDAHRVFDAEEFVSLFPGLELDDACFIDDDGLVQAMVFDQTRTANYGCGLFVLRRPAKE
jgi:SAM-dependent methyltransferase